MSAVRRVPASPWTVRTASPAVRTGDPSPWARASHGEERRTALALARHARTEPDQGRIADARAAERAENEVRAGRAARTVAAHAADLEECRELLAMLGLSAR